VLHARAIKMRRRIDVRIRQHRVDAQPLEHACPSSHATPRHRTNPPPMPGDGARSAERRILLLDDSGALTR
jgi:hypothetical protein